MSGFSGAPMDYDADMEAAGAGGGHKSGVKRERRDQNQSLQSLSVALLQRGQMTPAEGKFCIGNRNIQHVCLVGVSDSAHYRPSDHCIVLTLDDGSGKIAVSKIAAAEENTQQEVEMYGGTGTKKYIRVIGRPVLTRTSPFADGDQLQLSAYSITPVTDSNLVTCHNLRIIAGHIGEQAGVTRSSWDKQKHGVAPQAGGAAVQGTFPAIAPQQLPASSGGQQMRAPPTAPQHFMQGGGAHAPARHQPAPGFMGSQQQQQQQQQHHHVQQGMHQLRVSPQQQQQQAYAADSTAMWHWFAQQSMRADAAETGIDGHELMNQFGLTERDTCALFENWTGQGYVYCTVDSWHFKPAE